MKRFLASIPSTHLSLMSKASYLLDIRGHIKITSSPRPFRNQTLEVRQLKEHLGMIVWQQESITLEGLIITTKTSIFLRELYVVMGHISFLKHKDLAGFLHFLSV